MRPTRSVLSRRRVDERACIPCTRRPPVPFALRLTMTSDLLAIAENDSSHDKILAGLRAKSCGTTARTYGRVGSPIVVTTGDASHGELPDRHFSSEYARTLIQPSSLATIRRGAADNAAIVPFDERATRTPPLNEHGKRHSSPQFTSASAGSKILSAAAERGVARR